MSAASSTVEAVVVTHRRPKNLLPVMTALRAQSHQLSRITVIDASPSASFRPTAGFDLADCVMRLGTNFGAFNRYVPLLAYRADFTLFVDDDFTAGTDAVRRLVTVAAMRPDFGVIGEIGRTFAPSLEYSRRDVRAETNDAREVDLVIRGYFTRTPTLHALGETLWRLPAEWRELCSHFDDLLLAVAMKLSGQPSLVYRPNTATERLISRELPDDFALCHRRNHVPERVAFLRMARECLGWIPLSESAA